MVLKYLKDKVDQVKQIYKSHVSGFNFQMPVKVQVITLKDAQELAGQYNGRCLSQAASNAYSPLTWKCAKRHVWISSFLKIKQGSWCEPCMKEEERKRNSMEILNAVVERNGGKCLSANYKNSYTDFLVECAKEHTWYSNYQSIVSKKLWCPVCSKEKKISNQFKKINAIVLARNGRCLTEKYKNSTALMKWECEKGHVFSMTAEMVKKNYWCLKCNKHNTKEKKLQELHLIAKDKEGRCLSVNYTTDIAKLNWQCKDGHIWEMSAGDAKKGKWCRKCDRKIVCEKELKLLKRFARKKGGDCLATVYENSFTKIEWKCDQGHTWLASAVNVKKENGSWCPECWKNERKKKRKTKTPNIVIYKSLAKKMGGVLLSQKYINAVSPLKWMCEKGHVWERAPGLISKNNWCDECAEELTKRTPGS